MTTADDDRPLKGISWLSTTQKYERLNTVPLSGEDHGLGIEVADASTRIAGVVVNPTLQTKLVVGRTVGAFDESCPGPGPAFFSPLVRAASCACVDSG